MDWNHTDFSLQREGERERDYFTRLCINLSLIKKLVKFIGNLSKHSNFKSDKKRIIHKTVEVLIKFTIFIFIS